MPTQFRPPIEIWGNVQAAGGARLALIPETLDCDESKALDGHDLTIDLPLGFGASGQLQEGRAIRTVWRDGTFDEWRIQAVRSERKQGGGLFCRVEAKDPRIALGDVQVFRTESDGSHTFTFSQNLPASEHLSKFILPALAAEGYTWVVAGTITPTQPVEIAYDYTTALAAIQALAQALAVEFDFRRSGTTQYLIDLVTAIGSSATALQVRYARNLTGFTKIPDGGEIATRVIPRGADDGGFRAGCGRAQWIVTAVALGFPGTLTLADPLGGAGPILEDDQLNGKYVRRPSGTLDAISDSFASTQQIQVADASFYAVNDLVEIRRNSGGELLDFVESPLYGVAPPSGYGLRTKVLDRPDLAGTINVLANPAMRVYSVGSNSPPDNWKIIPGCGLAAANVDKETTAAFWRVGGSSAKIVAGGDGQGLENDWATIAPTDLSPYVCGFMGFWNDTNGAKIRVAMVLGLATVSISGTPTRATAGGITTVTVVTSAAHGLLAGDLVENLGITGGTTADGYNGIQIVARVLSTTSFEYHLAADPGTVSVSGATTRKVWRFVTTPAPVSKVWYDYGVSGTSEGGINAKTLGAVVAKMQLMQDGSTAATYYADRAQLTITQTQRAFIEGNGQTRLWQEAINYLRSHRQPPTRYEVNLLDLGRIDPTIWPFDDVTLGGTVAVADPDAAPAISTRMVKVKRKPLINGATSVELSTLFDDLTRQLAKPPRPPAANPPIPRPRRRRITLHVVGSKFIPKNSTDASHLSFDGANPDLLSGDTTGGTASAALGDQPGFRGATIVGIRAKLYLVNGFGTGTLKLYRDTTVIATLTAASSPQEQANMILGQFVGSENYRLDASLVAASGLAYPVLNWVDIIIDVDDGVSV